MKKPIIISVAPVSGNGPLDPMSVSRDVIACVDAGASVCHLHAKAKDGTLTPDITNISETFDRILLARDLVVQVSTGGISKMTIEERCYPLNYPRAETASLNGGTTNLGEAVYINSFEDIRYCAKECYERNILPEIEVFDIGMLHNIALIQKEMPFREPMFFNLVFGHRGGMQPTIEALTAFRSFVPKNAHWGVTHYGRDNWSFLAAAIAMGATLVRIGFEDSKYLEASKEATTNTDLVKKLTKLIEAMDYKPATPAEAREILKRG